MYGSSSGPSDDGPPANLVLPSDLMVDLIDIGVQVRDLIEEVSMDSMSMKKLTKQTIDKVEELKDQIVDSEAMSLKR